MAQFRNVREDKGTQSRNAAFVARTAAVYSYYEMSNKVALWEKVITNDLQAIPGVPKLPQGDAGGLGRGDGTPPAAANPATWMLDISAPACEDRLGVDFAAIFQASSHARHAALS